MSQPRMALLALAGQLLTSGATQARYAYVTHPSALVQQGTTTEVLPANPLRAFVYCVIASPGRAEPFAPSFVTMGNTVVGVPVQYPDRAPQVWASTGEVWVFSDQIALISSTELTGRMQGEPAARDLPR